MIENSEKIRELKEAMRAERDIRIRNRMMAVMGVLKGHSTKTASDFADVDQRSAAVGCQVQRVRHRWTPGRSREGQGFTRKVRSDQEAGRQACRQEHTHPEKAAELDTGEAVHPVQPVQRAQDPATPRVLVQEVGHPVRLGCRRRHCKAVAGRRRRYNIGCKKARADDRGAGRVHISQGRDRRTEAVVARREFRDCQPARQEGPDRRVRRACGGRNETDAAV